MCRDCGDTMRKVSCCVKLCFKNSDFDAIIVFAPSTPLKMSLTWKLKYGHIKSGTFVIVMLLNKRLTRAHSQKDPRLHFGESANLKIKKDFFFCQCYTIHVLINRLKKTNKKLLATQNRIVLHSSGSEKKNKSLDTFCLLQVKFQTE